ncbi:MAG: HypC/HybG/HupF family hydrogenase formation chaperone [Gammaproteobacteria bacterium]
MCMGIPMQVVAVEGLHAQCTGRGRVSRVSMMLTGPQPPGTWVLVHLGTAWEVLEPERAAQIDAALDAVEAALRGESLEGAFADLEGREPQLPAFLRQSATSS